MSESVRRPLLKYGVVFGFLCALYTAPAWTTTTQYVGPGSMGAVMTVSPSPLNANLLLAGTDVGGIYLSADGGANWKNITLNLPVQGVFSIAYSHDTIASNMRIILGTESGVYYSNNITVPISGCGATPTCNMITSWTEADGIYRTNLVHGKSGAFKTLHDRDYHFSPIGVISVDPTNPHTLWAGVARYGGYDYAADGDGSGAQVQHFDKWKVYRSLNRGQDWTPMLRFSEPVGSPLDDPSDTLPPDTSDSGVDVDGNVFGIVVAPDETEYVFVSTDRGLFRGGLEEEEGESGTSYEWRWRELGTTHHRVTADSGVTWDTMEPAGCEEWDSSDTADTATSWCLPTVQSAWVRFVIDTSGQISDFLGTVLSGVSHAEQHPNLRALGSSLVDEGDTSGSFFRLYAAAWDIGYDEDTATPCDPGDAYTMDDQNFERFRGGVYFSDDYGETWEWMFTDNGAPDGNLLFDTATLAEVDAKYRCAEDAPLRALSKPFFEMGTLSARPTYTLGSGGGSREVVLMAGSFGKRPGLFSYAVSPTRGWRYHSAMPGSSWTNYEGEAPYNLSEQPDGSNKGPPNGKIASAWPLSSTMYPLTFIFAGPRGALKASYATPPGPTGDYYFNHLGSDRVGSPSSSPVVWHSAGLDNACVFAAKEIYDPATYESDPQFDYLFVGASDAGLLRSTPMLNYQDIGAFEWQVNGCVSSISDPRYPWDCQEDYMEAETRAIEVDCNYTPCVVYAGNFQDDGGSEASVLMSEDEGASWEIIGGTGYDTGTGLNGLGSSTISVQTLDLQLIPDVEVLSCDTADTSTSCESVISGTLTLLAAGKGGLWGYVDETWYEICGGQNYDGDTTYSGLTLDTVSTIAYNADLEPDYAFVSVPSNDADSLIAIDLATLACESLNAPSSGVTFEAATTVAVASMLDDPQTSTNCDAEDSSPVLMVGASSTTTTKTYDKIYVADLSGGLPTSGSWSVAYDLNSLSSSLPSLAPSLDTNLWVNSLKFLSFSSIAVNPNDTCDVWAALGAGPYFDYVNAAYLFQWDKESAFDYATRQSLGLPNGNIKFLDFNENDQLYVGSCSSLYRVTF